MTTCEVVIPPRTPTKGRNILLSMAEAAKHHNIAVVVGEGYTQSCDLVMVYGYGRAPNRVITQKHVRKRRPAIVWDIGYWNRTNPLSYRLSIDGPHPKTRHFEQAPQEGRPFPPLECLYDPKGHVLLVSSLPKSEDGTGTYADTLYRQLREIRRHRPGNIKYRPKRGRPVILEDLPLCCDGSIREAIDGASLVVTQGGNISVDAAIYGVPCVVTGGIGAHFWPTSVQQAHLKTEEQRSAFLGRTAWFNWSAIEAREAWAFVRKLCELQ